MVILETLIDVMPGLNISFSSNVCKALFMLDEINQVMWSENFVPIKAPIKSSVLNLFFLVLLTTLRIKINVALEHALHSICVREA
jgi:hypothetical protein